VQARFPAPDVSAEYRRAFGMGYVEVAGILRYIKWDDNVDNQFDLEGDEIGWGVNVSSNINIDTKAEANDVVRLQAVYGEGIENYMNDAPADLGIENNLGDPVRPVKGKLLPVTGIVAFLDHTWNDRWTSAIGYSSVEIDNSDGQSPSAFKKGQYALANLMCTPVKDLMLGGEVQWGKRENFSDGWSVDDLRFQFSVKANFSALIGGKS
jgi:hypothetical protein